MTPSPACEHQSLGHQSYDDAQPLGVRHHYLSAGLSFCKTPNRFSFSYRGAVTWNSLSVEAKQATTLNSFYSAIVS